MKLFDRARCMVLGLRRRFDALRLDARGIAAVEFAFVLPIMLTLYLGCVEVTQGVIANRQITAWCALTAAGMRDAAWLTMGLHAE